MKRFECKNCGHFTCRVFGTEVLCNKSFECKETIFKTKWYEIAEEEEKTEIKAEEILNLPSWCKVGEVVYFTKLSKYCEVVDIDIEKGVKIQTNLSNGWVDFYDLLEARLRPFNEKEMRGVVGKVIEDNHNAHLVIGLIKPDPAENVSCFVRAGQSWITPDKLLQNYTLDSKPCGVYEHLENGEWVE